jgi:hypothetical protein
MQEICRQSVHSLSESEVDTLEKSREIIVCSLCSHHITEPENRIMVDGSFDHVFANPHGMVFEITCFSHARGCKIASMSSSEFSWFAGFTWQIAVCRYCTTHLGWFFSSGTGGFYGLILDKLIFL